MQRFTSYIRRPVRRHGAEQYMLVTLVSFAGSVTLTRLFLAMTGYPQLGGGELHIAHALWGGLFLFIAALLPLLYANRWVYLAGAILAGLGVGLFIDEIGKFITQSNNYFYPLAAPIVYAFFVATAMLYQRLRRHNLRSVRDELYSAFDALEEVLEQDLDEVERTALEARLRYVAENTNRDDLKQLAQDLLEFLRTESLHLAERRPGPLERLYKTWQKFEARWLNRRLLKLLLMAGLLGLAALALTKAGLSLAVIVLAHRPPGPPSTALESVALGLNRLAAQWHLTMLTGFFGYLDLALETLVGLLLLAAGGLLISRRDQLATALGSIGLVVSLTGVNLLVFYYDQFSSILTALAQLGLLISLAYYRQRYVPVQPTFPPVPSQPAQVPS
jgi:hypothetical protein